MEYRALGKTGLTVSEIGFGAWQLGASRAWGAMTDREALALVDGAMGAGCTLLPAGQPMPEAALAYILSYDAVSSAIPGARSLEQIAANTGAAGKRLSPALKSQVEALWDSLTAQGTNPMPW